MDHAATGTLHHIELWVPSLVRAAASWGWLLRELGYEPYQEWPDGQSWRAGPTYVVIEQSPARTAFRHDRCRPGLNHLAFYVGSREQVEVLAAESAHHGWRLMFADRHPFAGGNHHYAAYLENADGYEVELVGPGPDQFQAEAQALAQAQASAPDQGPARAEAQVPVPDQVQASAPGPAPGGAPEGGAPEGGAPEGGAPEGEA
jgi:catechol 2,3-dioxygenase-like lactoylglutathione lyase family enzyme